MLGVYSFPSISQNSRICNFPMGGHFILSYNLVQENVRTPRRLIYVVANTADRAYKQLSLTIGDDSAYRSAVSTIGNLSKKTLSSKGDVEAMVSELAALG